MPRPEKAWEQKGGMTTKVGKKILSAYMAFAFIAAACFAIGAISYQYSPVGGAQATTAVQNISQMVSDLVPSFILLVFVMVFMLMLLTIVDRVGRH